MAHYRSRRTREKRLCLTSDLLRPIVLTDFCERSATDNHSYAAADFVATSCTILVSFVHDTPHPPCELECASDSSIRRENTIFSNVR